MPEAADGPPPAISVLMSLRNGAAHLPATLNSLADLRSPSGQIIEFVIVDDGSDDETPALLAGWVERDDRVRVLRRDTPTGLAAALNYGLEACGAPLVARADGDDLYHPDRLILQADAFTDNPDLGVLSCGYDRISDDDELISTVIPPTGPDILRFRMLFMNPILHPGVMFRTAVVRDVGGYDPAYWTAQDSDLWARLRDKTVIDNLPDSLVRYRVHSGSVMKTRGDAGQKLSRSVPERLQTDYFGGELPYDVGSTVDLFQGFKPLSADKVRAGINGLQDIYAIAKHRETPAVLVDFRRQVIGSMLKQAKWIKGKAPLAALALWRAALAFKMAGSATASTTSSPDRKVPQL
ncbi:glycosyltransferase [Litoreibacter roseus]|uniref:Glycosyltransferase 2-like domain-containing protein n=1 Tax=Litoreibacter roseus TaxID=2601869 RepID=A0A6N6JHN2_9RHOB|nr:glycosyltransferase [Litoreibacter roseus]GFE64899.1 hypothetical protein KIN_19730 [Litoreibacter roseus]